MGNSSSSKMRKRSESMQIKYEHETFSKSKSVGDLVGSRKSIKGNEKNKSIKERTSSSSISRTKSMRRDISHPISFQGREIITQCFENPHSEFGNKVLQRIFEKRADYQQFVYSIGKDKSCFMSGRLKDLVEDVVAKIHDPDYISTVSRVYGEEHVELKQFGFKPDFWVAIADAITVEGVILDMANHQPADTVAAWSSLVTLMFSSVRDGYYSALRKHRMSSRRGIRRQNTIDSSREETTEDHPQLQSVSARSRISETSVMSTQSLPVAKARTERTGSINIMAPVASSTIQTTSTTLNSTAQALVTYRQRPIFE